MTKKDQNGTIHASEYDNFGRLLHDRVITLASGVDGAVRRITTTYTVTGQMSTLTSYDNPTVKAGNVVNQIAYEYDNCGQLSKEFSNPDGAVETSTTPWIGYEYDTTKDGEFFTKSLHQISLRYPSGKLIEYRYDTYGRPLTIAEDNADLVTYEYQDMASPIKTNYVEPQLSLKPRLHESRRSRPFRKNHRPRLEKRSKCRHSQNKTRL